MDDLDINVYTVYNFELKGGDVAPAFSMRVCVWFCNESKQTTMVNNKHQL